MITTGRSRALHPQLEWPCMGQTGYEKTLEEILRERAEILFRTGEKLSEALRELAIIDSNIERIVMGGAAESEHGPARPVMYNDINIEIERYNNAREYAKLRYFYLIVTREAIGFRRHTWVDEIYCIPPKKKPLKELHGQVQEPTPENG
jgi:hypothetical protein